MRSPTALIDLTLQGQIQGHSDFEVLSRRGVKLGPMLPLNINRKPYGESNSTMTFDLE